MDKHGLVCLVKELAQELGKTPTRADCESKVKAYRHMLKKHFSDSHSELLDACGLDKSRKPASEKQIRKYKALCSKVEKIHGFFRHKIDIKELFERAGNPKVLKVSVQPDTHAKFADKKALSAYIKFLTYYKPDVHIILGDFVDCEGLSHWPQDDLEPRRIVPEMKVARDILAKITESTPSCSTRIYLTGNHEHWIEQAFTRMPELFDGLSELDIEINLKSLLALEKFGYQIFPLNHIVNIGLANFTHGIYTGAAHASKHLNVFKANIYYGHLHDGQEFNATSMDGPLEAASLGCLCRLDAKFLKGKPNNWVHSHGVFEFFPDGTYTFTKPKILNGRFSYNGVIFEG
jgi:hypothetical protein